MTSGEGHYFQKWIRTDDGEESVGRGREQEIAVPICMEDIPGIDGKHGFSYGKTSV